jgi:hypothetical protein
MSGLEMDRGPESTQEILFKVLELGLIRLAPKVIFLRKSQVMTLTFLEI